MVVAIGNLKNYFRVERLDDIALLLQTMQTLGIGKSIDDQVKVHGHWRGASLGTLTEIWLSYILSEGDHRLNRLEDWAVARLYILQSFYPEQGLKRTDFTDDKLELVLDYLIKDDNWSEIERLLNGRILRGYNLGDKTGGLLRLRLDATIGQAHKEVKTGGLFQRGHAKHFNPNLPQIKTMLSTLDTQIRGQSFPLCQITVSGNTSDDVLYQPIIERSKLSLSETSELLIVGDKKMSSLANRTSIVSGGDYYLSPLSKVQLPQSSLIPLIDKALNTTGLIQAICINGKCIGKGFEVSQTYCTTIEVAGQKKELTWTERRLIICSTKHCKAQLQTLQNRLQQAQAALAQLLQPKQGKSTAKTRYDIQQAIDRIVAQYQVGDYLQVTIHQKTTTRHLRKYGDRPAQTIKEISFKLSVQVQQDQIDQATTYAGWVVYVTNASKDQITLNDAVKLYKEQFQIESRFNDLKNKVTKLLPLFLQKDHRVESLVYLLMMGLKVICALEVKVAKALKQMGDKLQGIFPGNPKRASSTPTAKMLLQRFKGISLIITCQQDTPVQFGLTPIDQVQRKILQLMGLPPDLYEQLINKLNLIFLTQFKRT